MHLEGRKKTKTGVDTYTKCLMFTLAAYIGVTHVQKDNASVMTSGRCMAHLAKMSINLKFVELAGDVSRTIL